VRANVALTLMFYQFVWMLMIIRGFLSYKLFNNNRYLLPLTSN